MSHETFEQWFERTQKLPFEDIGAFHSIEIRGWVNSYIKTYYTKRKRVTR